MKELDVAKELARKAGDVIMQLYDDYDSSDAVSKDDARESPLTSADLAANDVIVSGLKEHFSSDSILTEEAADDLSRLESSRVWIVDPLDGTKEFLKKNGEFTVNIALVVDHVPVMGVVYVPAKNKLYYASSVGAFLESNGELIQLSVSDVSDFSLMMFMGSRSHVNPRLQNLINELGVKHFVAAGSSLKGCLVASADADVYVRLGPQNEWDIAAMHAIVIAAGGQMTGFDGEALLYNQQNPLKPGLVVSNGVRHSEIVACAKKWID